MSGNEKVRQNDWRCSWWQRNKFTYMLEMRNQERMVRSMVRVKFTYSLEMKKQDRMVRGMVRVKSTSSHTGGK